MKLQYKILLLGTLMLVTILATMVLFSTVVLQHSYDTLERGDTIDEMDRGVSALQNDQGEMTTRLFDWAFWDDTYQFTQGRSPTYIKKNLMEETFQNFNLNGLLVYNQTGNLIYAQGFDLTTREYADLPEGLNVSIAAHHSTLFSGTDLAQDVNGTLLLPGGPVLIVSAPILTSSFEGPSAGTMMMVRSLDQHWLSTISSRSGIPISILTPDQAAIDPNLSGEVALLSSGEPLTVPVSSDIIKGYQRIPDLDGRDGFILSVENTREITKTGTATIAGYLEIVGLAGILWALIVLLILRRTFLKRVDLLITGVGLVQQGDAGRMRLREMKGDDELDILASAINRMLDEIDRAQAATRASELRYRGVVEDQTEMICRVDAAWKVTFMNNAFRRYFGEDQPDGQESTTLFPMIPDFARQKALAFLSDLTPEEPAAETEIRFPHEGKTQWVAWTIRGIFDPAGAPAEYQFVGRDVTAQKEGLVELQQYRDHLEDLVAQRTEEMMGMQEELLSIERLESVGILAGGIAHDFNNLLAAIRGNIELVRMDLDEESPLDERMAEMERVVLRATALTRQLLTFAKGGAPIRKRANLGPVISDTAVFTCRGSPVRCTCSIADDLRVTEVDLDQISQVINNIILNGIQAMPEGGTINITAENQVLDGTEPIPLPAGEYVRITIADEGIGIAPEQLSRVFDPFFTTKAAGSGLGLSTSFSIVRQHNGLILVNSAPDKGTSFSILIPAVHTPVTGDEGLK
jgi:PAS domain S-box-containing protein